MNIRFFLAVEKVADPHANVAVRLAGTYPYFSKRLCFDLLGKCDPYIASLPAHSEITRAGHNKFDHTYSFTIHRPDIILHMLDTTNDAFYRHYRPIIVEVDDEEIMFCVRKDNPVFKGYETARWRDAGRCLLETERQRSEDF